MHQVSEMCSGSFIGGIVAGALALAVVSLAIYVVSRFVKRRKEMENGLDDAQARINVLCERLVQKFPDINLEYDPTATQNVAKPSIRERLGIKKWHIVLASAIVALVIGTFVVTYNDDAPKEHGRSAKHADEALAASSSKSDVCGRCKVEKVPNEDLTTKSVGNGFLFLGNKCVGSDACAACEVDNCTGPDNENPPTGLCNHCSPKAN
jgi:hypothetical protein